MLADTPLEIWTTAIGWTWYNILWDIVTATGIVFIPFVAMLVTAWRDAYVAGGEQGAAARCVREMESKVYMALLVIIFAGLPCPLTPVSPATTQYTPTATVADPNPPTADGSNSGDTFGQSFGALKNQSADVPFWWYAVMKLSSGINQAAMAGIGSGLTGLRELQQQSGLLAIADPALRAETIRFYNECYIPARTKFMSAEPSPVAAAAIKTHGVEDTEWIGSHAFLDDLTLYPAIYAAAEIPGWPFNAGDSSAADVAGEPDPPLFARPSCHTWWTASKIGIQDKLLRDAKLNGVDLVTRLKSVFAFNDAKAQDVVARSVLTNEGPAAKATPMGVGDAIAGGTRNTVNWVTASIAYAINWFVMGVVVPGLKFVQPLLLMGMYAMMGLYLILARFELEALIIGALGIFSVKFWTVLWFGVDWLDEHLIAALYPSSDYLMGRFVLTLKQLTTVADGDLAKRVILDMVIFSLYVLLPALWTGMMAWAGLRTGMALRDLSAVKSDLNGAGNPGGVFNKLRGRGGR